MALQPPFLNPRRESASDAPVLRRTGGAYSAVAHRVGSSGPLVHDDESRLTVGPNIKLKTMELTDCDTLVVQGSVEASMGSRLMQITESGCFKGTAEVDMADIRGHFEGSLSVRETLVIHASGRVSGRVRYGRLVIEEGGQISGEIEAGPIAVPASRPALQAANG